MNQRIECQACTAEDREAMRGCSTCGGYGFLLQQRECPLCKRKGWSRPGNWTVYEGKRYRIFDGMEFVAHLGKPDNCAECEKTS